MRKSIRKTNTFNRSLVCTIQVQDLLRLKKNYHTFLTGSQYTIKVPPARNIYWSGILVESYVVTNKIHNDPSFSFS